MTIGFDIGRKNCAAAVTRKNTVGSVSGGNFIDITLDEGSKRSVSPAVCFPQKERAFGNEAAKKYKSNIASTIRTPQILLGKTFDEALPIWNETESVPLVAGPLTTGGVTTPVFEIEYQGETIHVTPEHAVSIILRHKVKHCKELDVFNNECCMAIPNNYGYTARQALLEAAKLADLNPLKLICSTSCLALDYGLLGGQARGPESATLFLDLGHGCTNMGVVKFFEGGWEVIAVDSFEGFSGFYLDRQMIRFFANDFEKKHGANFMGNAKAVNKVETILGKMKKNLVVNDVASYPIDFLYNDEDFTCRISREEMWNLCQDRAEQLLEYLKHFLEAAQKRLGDCKFGSIECVGGVSRMADLRTRLSQVLQETIGIGTLQSQLNTDEAVARGGVLQCAILSPRFAIQERKVKNIVPFSILVGRQPSDFPIDNWEECNYEILFPVWSELNKTKSITFKKPKSLRIMLVEENTVAQRTLIGWVDINADGCSLNGDKEKWKKFQVIVDLDASGLLSFRVELTKSRLEMVDVAKDEEVDKTEEEYAADLAKAQEEARVKAEAERENAIKTYKQKLAAREKAKAEAAEKNTESQEGDGDVVMEEPPQEPEEELKNPEEEELVIPEVTVSKTKMQKKVEKVEKTRIVKEDVPCVFTSRMGMLEETKEMIRALESKQATYDNEQFQIQSARNDLESYVLEAQDLYADGGLYFDYMTEEEAETFMNSIFEMDEYLCDDMFDKEILEYREKLQSLTVYGDTYKSRKEEWEKRPRALEMFKKLLTSVEMFLMEGHKVPDFEHIIQPVLEELGKTCQEANLWLDERQQFHNTTSKQQDPPYQAVEVSQKISEVNSAFAKVKQTPKPPPPAEEEKPAAEPKAEEDVEMTEPKAEATANEEAPEADVQMEEN